MASAHYAAGNLDLAERFFNDAAHYPGMLGDAYSNLGAIAMRRGDVKQALWYLSRAAKRRPEKAGIRFNHALALHKLGRSADALNELRAAEQIDRQDVGVRFLAGVVCLRLGLLREAEEYFRAILKLDPGHKEARHNLALRESIVSPKDEGSLSLVNGDDRDAPAPAPPPPAERSRRAP
jgi:Flp pilus assembly protein TadD